MSGRWRNFSVTSKLVCANLKPELKVV